tara:strand:- start:158 stop:1096 length:939 start_codon:yes stop_codon:yes gene_type:complete
MENVAIIMGGTSEESPISIQSGNTIKKYIDKKKYNAFLISCINTNEFHVLINNNKYIIDNSDFSFRLNNKTIIFQKVFMMIHGKPGENGELCKYFEDKKIPYTSSNETASILTFNKYNCNNYLKSLRYHVPNSQIYKVDSKIEFPCIIKPSCSGSSFGISKIYNSQELPVAIQKAQKYGNEIIIEEFIEGREITCAVYQFNSKITTLPLTEIISQNDIFDYKAKYQGQSIEETPAKIAQVIKNNITDISKKLYVDLNLRGIVRIDFILKNQTPYLIEVNTIPGFSEKSIVPQMLKCAKINITDFITEQIENI